MITVSSLWYMILIELLAVTTLVSIVLIALKYIQQRRDRAAAARLVHRIKEDGTRRREESVKVMQRKFGFDEDAAKKLAVRIGREERVFYQDVINFYLRRDAVVFENLNIDLESVVGLYRKLEPPGLGGGESSNEAEQVDESEEIRRLTIENKRLSDEVGITMQTMSRMLDEYSSMFAGGATDGLDKEQIIQQLKGDAGEAEGDAAAEAELEPVEGANAEPEPGDEEDTVDVFQEEPAQLVDGMDDLSDLDPGDGDNSQLDDNPDETLG